ncbi:hypothetical protein [Halorussus aquaticus]|uniref:Tat (Twin-arginine translocation) pathway signal sequence n=1 Tax=Halorussus aquaticus TaxID=2953748 RepID=A0ABD5Q3T7_9EURY|nr:hypothetical protein [Halorussus aquaticus]
MAEDGNPLRRRDVLRAGAAAGAVGLGWVASGVSAQDQRARNAYSYSLQQGDRFRVWLRPQDSAGNARTETIPEDCTGGQPGEYQIFIVRAHRDGIDLGYEGLFVPSQAVSDQTTGTTTTEATETTTETTTTADTTTETTTTADTTTETTTTADTTTETTGETETTTTTETTTEAALQEETTTANETTTSANETATTTETTTPANETMTPDETTANETTVRTDTTAAETTPPGESGLPEIQVGEWYRVTTSIRCDALFQLSLEPAEPRDGGTGS